MTVFREAGILFRMDAENHPNPILDCAEGKIPLSVN
jgi:hypothetical protein